MSTWPRRAALLVALIPLTAWGAVGPGTSEPPAPATEPPTPVQLADRAIQAHPDLAARRARVDELSALARAAGAWGDPMLGLELSNVPVDALSLGAHPMSGVQLRLAQAVPAPGVLRGRREVAEGRARQAGWAAEEAELALRGAVETTWWRLTRVRQLRELTGENLGRTAELGESVRARYEVGDTGQSSVLRLGVLESRLRDDLGDFDRQDRELTAMLARALAVPSARFTTPLSTEPRPVDGDLEAWFASVARHPTLAHLDERRSTEERAARLAWADRAPDVVISAGYRVRRPQSTGDPGTNQWTVGVGVPIPTGSTRRARGQREAHLAAASRARAERDAAVLQLHADLELTHASWSRAWDKATTYREVLIPGARAAQQSTLAELEVGEADLTALYQAEVQLLELERAAIAASVETHIQEAHARATVGGPLTGAPR